MIDPATEQAVLALPTTVLLAPAQLAIVATETSGIGATSTGTTGGRGYDDSSYNNTSNSSTSGPHSSGALNKLDPRVDNTTGTTSAGQRGYGDSSYGTTTGNTSSLPTRSGEKLWS